MKKKALFDFVPYLELLVEAIDGVVGDVIVEILYAEMFHLMQRLNRHLLGKVTAAYNGLWAVPVRGKREAEDKAGFAVRNEPEVVFLALYLNDSFVSVPLAGVEIGRRNKRYGNVLEHGAKLVHQLLMIVWDTWIFITVRKIRAILRKEFLPR